jgi:hypothetical protein
MTDTTRHRRALLGVLLDRLERGVLLPAEVLLLRPLVTAEQAAADARPATRITVHDDATSAAVRPLLDDLDTLRVRAEQAEDLLRIAHETSNRSESEREHAAQRAEQAEAAVARVRGYARTLTAEPHPIHDHECPDDVRAAILSALDGPSPASDDAPTPRLDALRAGQPITLDAPSPEHVGHHTCIDGSLVRHCRESCTACVGREHVVACMTCAEDAPSEPQP